MFKYLKLMFYLWKNSENCYTGGTWLFIIGYFVKKV